MWYNKINRKKYDMGYYDGTKLLSMKDINGNTPEIFISSSNRTAGKTTYWNRYVVNRYLKGKGKFMLVYRYKYELDSVSDKFFKDIGSLFFSEYHMTEKTKGAGIYKELMLNGIPCGYAVCLSSADGIKKQSHEFSDTSIMLFDEFQSETSNYCPNEVQKFQSIHTSVARGQGEMVRYVPVIMVSNPVTLLNPYYTAMGISTRLNSNTKFLKGNGFVLEQGFNEEASNKQISSGFNRAFANSEYVAYASQGVYLNDNKAFIEKPTGKSTYVCTIKYNNVNFGIREFAEQGIVYCDDKADTTFPRKISVTTEDHNINYVMLKRNDVLILNLRYYFDNGCFRFKDLRSKEALMKCISY